MSILAAARPVALRRAASRGHAWRRRPAEGALLFASGLLGYLALATWLNFGLDYVPSDAVSRVANGFYVVGSRDPHLGAIGFVWNPLPSLLDIPLVLLRPVAPWLVTRGFAGCIQTAFFGAASLPVLSALLRQHDVPRRWRLLLVTAYALNPMTAMYSANGMSDVPFMFTLLLAWLLFARWRDGGSNVDLALLGVVMAIATLIRYEAIAVAVAIAGAIVVVRWRRVTAWREIETDVVVYILPVAVAVVFWLAANAMIMGDALYFLHSAYGNLAQQSVTSTGGAGNIASLQTWSAAARFSWSQWYHLYPAFIVAALLAATLGLWRRDTRGAAAMLCITIPVLVMQTDMVHSGASGLWVRYWMSVIPGTFLLLGYAVRSAPAGTIRGFVLSVAAVAAIAGDVGTGVTVSDPRIGLEEHDAMGAMLHHTALSQTFLDRAQRLDRELFAVLPADRLVLVDSFLANPIVLNADDPTRFVTTSDEDFQASLDDPNAHHVDYFLVPKPVGDGTLDAVNREYPTMWLNGSGTAKLLRDFGGPEYWRLYDVTGIGVSTP